QAVKLDDVNMLQAGGEINRAGGGNCVPGCTPTEQGVTYTELGGNCVPGCTPTEQGGDIHRAGGVTVYPAA
ncbi:hypothetical protein KUCAC02_012369, partial [Chaenocephalus aceratus]